MDIVALEQAEGGEWTIADAMGTSVGEKNDEAVGDEELRVSGHTEAVVAEAMEEEDGVPIRMVWVNGPGAKGDVIGRVMEASVEDQRRGSRTDVAKRRDFIFAVSGRRAGCRVPSAR